MLRERDSNPRDTAYETELGPNSSPSRNVILSYQTLCNRVKSVLKSSPSPNRVTISTHDLALVHLFQKCLHRAKDLDIGYFCLLLEAWQMIKLHRCWMILMPAVSTGSKALDFKNNPLHETLPHTIAFTVLISVVLVVLCLVLLCCFS